MAKVANKPSNKVSFRERLMDIFQNRKFVGLPASSPQVVMAMGVGKRSARCHVCHETIVYGSRRVEFMVRFQSERRYMNGGRAFGQACYCHPECIVGFINDVSENDRATNYYSSGRTCFECREPITPANQPSHSLVLGSKLGIWLKLCSTCVNTAPYRKCEGCGVMYERGRLVKVIKPADDDFLKLSVGDFVCKICEQDNDLVTERTIRKEKTFLKKVANLHDQTSDWIRNSGHKA